MEVSKVNVDIEEATMVDMETEEDGVKEDP